MNVETELISIIVPVYNVEQYVSDCVKSIINQTYKNLEIILVNDGSTDKSYNICKEFETKDKRIKVINEKNGGVSKARNRGLEIARGNYIGFVDSDDTITEDYVELLYSTLKKYDADCVNVATNYVRESDARCVVERKNFFVKILNQAEAIEAICYLKQVFPSYDMAAVWGCLYKRSLIESLRFNPYIKIGEDFLFKFLAFQKVNKVVCVNQPCYNYLLRKNSAMHTGFDERKVESIRNLEKEIDKVNEKYKIAYISRIVNISIVILFMIPIKREYAKERDEISHFIKKYRKNVLYNPKTRKKVKMALALSYVDFNILQIIFFRIKKFGLRNE